ncbi:hypothetical protein, partial [Lysinibacillus sp. 54212]|uniref:hypothetical protein n=1 Tax=Lysinibacillus sp. 54212 TaxID=3119829 RepID=UPI002FC725FC
MKCFISLFSITLCLLFVNGAHAASVPIGNVEYSTDPEGLTSLLIPNKSSMRTMAASTPTETLVFTNWQGLLDQVPYSMKLEGSYYNNVLKEAYDNNPNTTSYIQQPGAKLTITFDDIQDIGNIYFGARDGSLIFSFYNEQG